MWGKAETVLAASVAVILAGASAILLLLHYVDQQMRLRIVHNPRGGVLMAVSAEGLRELYALYALPKICADPTFQSTADGATRHDLCWKLSRPITPEMIKKGIVMLLDGTRATSLGTQYLLEGGRFAASSYSPASINGAITDGAVEVEHIKITPPPGGKLEGWVVSQFLQRTLVLP